MYNNEQGIDSFHILNHENIDFIAEKLNSLNAEAVCDGVTGPVWFTSPLLEKSFFFIRQSGSMQA